MIDKRGIDFAPSAMKSDHNAFGTILVVDDDVEAAEEIVSCLAEEGWQSLIASDGMEALRLTLERADVQIILSDIRMPRMDGLTFAAELRRQAEPDRDFQIIFITGQGGIDEAVAAIRLRAVDFLRKPIVRDGLLEAVSRARETLRERSEMNSARERAATELRWLGAQVHNLAQSLGIPMSSSIGGMAGAVGDAASESFSARKPAADPIHPVGRRDRGTQDPTNERYRRVMSTIRARAARSVLFETDLFSDPCWDMLLDLMEARLAGKQVPVSSLCTASGVPQTTALRRIDELVKAKLVERVNDRNDKRRILVRLTDEAAAKLERYFDAYSGVA
jgi:CheY-like chemotaxis protein/DNA-binding MarR family transcriptional regulator